jgi:osmotically-inducible protein OsmY
MDAALRAVVIGLLALGAGLAGGAGLAHAQSSADPTWPMDGAAADRLLADRVFIRLVASPSLNRSDLTITAEEGSLTLAGRVPNLAARSRALREARRTPGVREVVDELIVNPLARKPVRDVSDEQLVRQVAEAVAARTFDDARARENWLFGWEVDARDGDWEMDVAVDEGIVELSGTVPTAWDVRKVVDTVRSVSGVRAIRARLQPLDMPNT